MSKKEEDYSAYLTWQSNYATTWALLSGFTFTAITMILFQYPAPTQIQAQISLFILTIMLDTFLWLLHGKGVVMENCVRVAPPLPEKETRKEKPSVANFIGNHFSWIMLGASVIMMFLVWNLIYLTLATTAVGLLVIFYTYVYQSKPWNEFLKTRPFTRR